MVNIGTGYLKTAPAQAFRQQVAAVCAAHDQDIRAGVQRAPQGQGKHGFAVVAAVGHNDMGKPGLPQGFGRAAAYGDLRLRQAGNEAT